MYDDKLLTLRNIITYLSEVYTCVNNICTQDTKYCDYNLFLSIAHTHRLVYTVIKQKQSRGRCLHCTFSKIYVQVFCVYVSEVSTLDVYIKMQTTNS